VAEELLDVRRVRAAREKQGRAGVLEVVEADIGELGTLEEGLEEAVVEVVAAKGHVHHRGKHKAVLSRHLAPTIVLS
jgi:hypothetical protein